MRFILRKFVDADSAKQALALDKTTPVHDCYLKNGEEPVRGAVGKDCIGFTQELDPNWRNDEIRAKR